MVIFSRYQLPVSKLVFGNQCREPRSNKYGAVETKGREDIAACPRARLYDYAVKPFDARATPAAQTLGPPRPRPSVVEVSSAVRIQHVVVDRRTADYGRLSQLSGVHYFYWRIYSEEPGEPV